MPLKDSDDVRKRLKFGSTPEGSRRAFSDVQPTFSSASPRPSPARPSVPKQSLSRNFPAVGTTLSSYQSSALPGAPAAAAASAAALPTVRNPLFADDAYVPLTRTQQRGSAVKKRRRKLFTKKKVTLVVVLLILLAAGWMGSKVLFNVQKIFQGNVFSILTVTKLRGEDSGRVNILLAGNSADDPGHDGANLTDSIMVVSIDTKNNTAFMMSVPRDLYVNIPGYGHAKINEAYVDGQTGHFSQSGFPNGGMGLLEEVIQQNLGLTIDYYSLVDYNALRDAVNDVGGIDINVQSSDPRGLYDPSIDYATHGPLVKLTNGMHHLSGEQALDLARARGDAYGSYGFPSADFNRTANQRLIILAIKNKVLTSGVLANPITMGNLFDSIGKNVHTDMQLSEVRRLYDLGKNLNSSNIQSVGLNDANGVNLLASYMTPNGEDALIPAAGIDDFSKIQAFIRQLTSNDPLARESATIVVLNGTSVTGLAAKAQTTLTSKGLNVSQIGDAHAATATTTIIDASGGTKPATLQVLENTYGKTVTTTNPYAQTYTADFIIVLGNDQAQAVANAQ